MENQYSINYGRLWLKRRKLLGEPKKRIHERIQLRRRRARRMRSRKNRKRNRRRRRDRGEKEGGREGREAEGIEEAKKDKR
jgi:hypothetical protein